MRRLLLLFVCWVAPLSAQTLDSVRSYQAMRVDSTTRWYSKTVVRVDTLRLSLPSKAPSIPVGPYYASLAVGGAFRYGDPQRWKAQLDSVRGKGSIFFALTTKRGEFLATRVDGSKYFSVALWKAEFDRLWAGKADSIAPYLADGTIAAVYVMDEPNCGSCWLLTAKDSAITPSQVDSVAGYVKSKWRYATITARVIPQWLVNTPNVDAGWAQWEGPLHLPSNGMTAKQFADSNVKAAKARGMGLVLAMNVPDGGDGSSRMHGTFTYKDPNLADSITRDARGTTYRYAMSGAEVEAVGGVFVAEPYVCAVTGWINPQTVARPDIVAAWAKLAATPRMFTPCRRP